MSEKKSDLYYFSKFVNELRYSNAEIYYKGTTYTTDNKYNTIKRLLGDICEFDSKTKVDTVTREHYLTNEHTRDGKSHETHENVVNQLAFFFQKNNGKALLSNKTDFYIERNGDIGDLYRNLSLSVNELLIQYFWQPDIESIFKIISQYNSDSPTVKKLQDKGFLENSSLKEEVQQCFKKITARYCHTLVEENRIIDFKLSGYIIPEYNLGYSNALNHSNEQEIEVDNTILYSRLNNFDSLRYKRIRLLKEEIIQNNISNWPPPFIAHLFIMKLEEICIAKSLLEIVFDELNFHLNFAIYTSSDGLTIKLQKEIDNWDEVATYLHNYRFPDGFKNYLEPKRDTILEGNFIKHPDKLVSKNQYTISDIKKALFETLAVHFFTILCKEIGLDYHNNERCRKLISQKAYFNSIELI